MASSCHPAPPATPDAVSAPRLPVVALVGRPNVGKSTFLARASRRFVETANAPGTTVSLDRRRVRIGTADAWLVDLPGTRALDDTPAGEDPFWTLILEAAPDAILVVADAGHLERHLPIALACRDLGLPVVLAANLTDEASARGISVDTGRLAQLLNGPVHATCGRTGEGVDAALADAVRLARTRLAVQAGESSPRSTIPAPSYPWAMEQQLRETASDLAEPPRSLGAAAVLEPLQAGVLAGVVSGRGAATLHHARELEPLRWAIAGTWAAGVERHRDVPEPLADRFGRWSTAPWPGIPLFLGISFLAFLAVIVVGGWLAGTMGAVWAATPRSVCVTRSSLSTTTASSALSVESSGIVAASVAVARIRATSALNPAPSSCRTLRPNRSSACTPFVPS